MVRLVLSLVSLLFLGFVAHHASGFVITGQSRPTLYNNSTDHVIQLWDDIGENIYNSKSLWIVEFYMHWCGHCQNFAPKWMKVAEKMKSKTIDYTL